MVNGKNAQPMKLFSKQSRGDIIFTVINTIVMALVLFVCAYPLYYILIASVSDPTFVNTGSVTLIPKGIMLDGYRSIFKNAKIWIGYKNTILYTVTGTLLNVCLTMTGAYALSRTELLFRKQIMVLITFTMFFNGGMIPNYLLVSSLGLKNTIWAIILPTALSVWNLIIAKTYYQSTIPKELIEAAEVDGCGTLRFFFKIALPLSLALVAVMALFYAVAHWNAFFNALIYLDHAEMHPLQLVLRDLLLVNMGGDSSMLEDAQDGLARQKLADLLKFGVIIVSTIPVLCIYPFIQRYFVKGVMIGSVKG